MFFVSGLTGKVGGAAARRLLEKGCKVRTLARDPAKAAGWADRGVDVRQGDFDDAASVAAALEGVDGAFVMLPPVLAPSRDYAEARTTIASLVTALRQAAPPKIVALSSIGSEQASGLGLITGTHLLEDALAGLASPKAFVRAGSFIDNALHGLPRAIETGVFDSFQAPVDRPVPMVGTADIGTEVARWLMNDWIGTKTVELGSPASPDDLARAMAEVTGKPVAARAIPRERWAAVLEAIGMAPGTTWAYEEMMDGINSGWIAFGVPGTEPVAATTTPAEVFAAALDSGSLSWAAPASAGRDDGKP
jgi:uncharacterized protein YbjT (DUF2867 family)